MAKLTAAQARNLEIIRSAGGTIVRKHFEWFAPGTTKPIRGLNGNALKRLKRADLIRESWTDGRAHITLVPAQPQIVDGRPLVSGWTCDNVHAAPRCDDAACWHIPGPSYPEEK